MVDVSPRGARSLDDLANRLTRLRAEAGAPSYAEIALRIGESRERRGAYGRKPGKVTVYGAFREGRSRIDMDLVSEIVAALGHPAEVPQWRAAHAQILRAIRSEESQPGPAAPPAPAASGPTSTSPRSSARPRVTILTTTARPRVVVVEPHTEGVPEHRSQEIDALADPLVAGGELDSRIAVVTGLAGVGKTAVARAAALQVIRAVGAGPLLEVALRTGSGDAGVGHADPATLAEEITQARKSLTTSPDQRWVVLLDDAVTAQDVLTLAEHLGPHATLMVTSRRELTVPGAAVHVRLQPLSQAASLAMLRSLLTDGGSDLGPTITADGELADAEQEALDRLVGRCGGLPLALVVLAGQISSRTGWTLEDHAERLERSTTTLVPSLAAAYEGLPPDLATALRYLALHPGHLDRAESTALLRPVLGGGDGDEGWTADVVLDGLAREHLVKRGPNGRFELHDLVRSLAAAEGLTHEPRSRRQLATTALGESLLAQLEARTTDPAGVAWFAENVETFVTTTQVAGEVGLPALVSSLAAALVPWLTLTLRWPDAVLVNDVARQHGLPEQRASAERSVASALNSLGRPDEAAVILERLALDTADPLHHRTLGLLATVHRIRGELDRSVATSVAARDRALELDDPAEAVRSSGMAIGVLIDLGHYEEALVLADESLPRLDEGQAWYRPVVLVDIARAHVAAARWDAALVALDEASVAAEAIGHEGLVAYSDAWRGEVLLGRGDATGAHALLSDAERRLRTSGPGHVRAEVMVTLAESLIALGRLAEARGLAAGALALAEQGRLTAYQLRARLTLGQISLAEGDLATARSTAEDVVANTTAQRTIALALLTLGDVAAREADETRARRHWEQVTALGMPAFTDQALRRLGDGLV